MLELFALTFLLLHISIGLAIGFWLLVTALHQAGWLKPLGVIFGWLIIALTTILLLIFTIFIVKYTTDKEFRENVRKHKMMHYEQMQMMDKENKDSTQTQD